MKVLIISISLISLVTFVAGAILPWHVPVGKSYDQQQCMVCQFSASLINYFLKSSKGPDLVHRVTSSFCQTAQIESPEVCLNVTKLFTPEIVKVLSNGLFKPSQICGLLSNNTCGHFNNPMADWEVNLNVSHLLNLTELAERRKIEEARKQPMETYRVIHISDTHVDLDYVEGSIANCGQPLCCRNTSTKSNATVLEAGYWGSYGSCDVPMRTFESALKKLNSTIAAGDDIDYIIWTGDIQPHDVWMQDKETAKKTYDQVFSKIFEYLPNAQIYPTLGNHEMVPVDSFSPSNLYSIAREDSPVWLYRELDAYWSRWLPKDTERTILKDGFYVTKVRPGLKVVSLNTNFCHDKNFWLYINSTDPGHQLEWLIHELIMSELEHEQVHIIGHIPPGTKDCMKIWSKNFNRIVRRFSNTITGQFYGHTHNNEFELFYDQGETAKSNNESSPITWRPVASALIAPSITTFIDLNPGFRIYHIDPNRNFEPVDFESYYMDLGANNKGQPSEEPEWLSLGLFTEIFGVEDISPKELHNLIMELVKDVQKEEQLASKRVQSKGFVKKVNSRLFELYRLFNSNSDILNKTTFDRMTTAEKKAFLCVFVTGQSYDDRACNMFVHGDSLSLPTESS